MRSRESGMTTYGRRRSKMEARIQFTVKAYWQSEGLVIECPSAAARDFVARSLDDKGIIVRLKRAAQRGEGVNGR